MEPTENITKEQALIRYMTILFLLVSFLSILGLFLLSKIYWKDTAATEIQKSSIAENAFCHNASYFHNSIVIKLHNLA